MALIRARRGVAVDPVLQEADQGGAFLIGQIERGHVLLPPSGAPC
jgi:hypothetical protein